VGLWDRRYDSDRPILRALVRSTFNFLKRNQGCPYTFPCLDRLTLNQACFVLPLYSDVRIVFLKLETVQQSTCYGSDMLVGGDGYNKSLFFPSAMFLFIIPRPS
jgi:hypothetical protein